MASAALPPNPLPGRPRAPRRQRHRHGGPQWPPRRGAPHPADARRGGLEARGDLPGAGGEGRGRRQRQRPLGPEEMETVLWADFRLLRKSM